MSELDGQDVMFSAWVACSWFGQEEPKTQGRPSSWASLARVPAVAFGEVLTSPVMTSSPRLPPSAASRWMPRRILGKEESSLGSELVAGGGGFEGAKEKRQKPWYYRRGFSLDCFFKENKGQPIKIEKQRSFSYTGLILRTFSVNIKYRYIVIYIVYNVFLFLAFICAWHHF